MPEQLRFPREAWLPLLAGLGWLWLALGHGVVFTTLAAVPGCLLLGSGVAMLLWPGDPRITHFGAAGGVIGAVLSLAAVLVVGFWSGLVLLGLSALGFVACGGHALRLEEPTEGVPAPNQSVRLSAQVAADEALLASMVAFMPFPSRSAVARIAGEVAAATEVFGSKGWLADPVDYHPKPPPLESPTLRPARTRGTQYDHMSFDSGYRAHPDEPGAERWHSYVANRTAHAWVLRHHEENRPWLVCIHGYQMGSAGIDLLAFPPAWLHHELGLNLLVPVLPLHGARKAGRRSGDGFLTGDVMDSIHAEAQAMWDIRRMLGWVREQGDAPIGVLGYSLGGYNTALLATLDEGLACAIAGIPLADIPGVLMQHGSTLEFQEALENGFERQMREVMQVVSPLRLQPRVPVDGRYIFGAVADRLVPAAQVRDLWEHWDRPRIEWYQGAHITFRAHSGVQQLMAEGLRKLTVRV
jgi:dienelactone hydrolase